MSIDEIEDLISRHGSITAQPLMDLVVTVVLEAVEAEREACAALCEARFTGDLTREDMEAKRCAAAIRARSQS